MTHTRSILELRPDQLVSVGAFRHIEVPDAAGRVTIFEGYRHGHEYSLGCDFALGIAGRDFDAAVVLDATDTPPRQVATAHGRWGERFDRVLYALIRYYRSQVFVFGERQVGLPMLRSLVHTFGHGWIYYERSQERRGTPSTRKYGYPKTARRAREPLLREFRLAVRDNAVLIRDRAVIAQMAAMRFVPRTKIKEGVHIADDDLDVRLDGGGSPDLVYGAMYALEGVSAMGKFLDTRPIKPAEEESHGTLGYDPLQDPEGEYEFFTPTGGRARAPRRTLSSTGRARRRR